MLTLPFLLRPKIGVGKSTTMGTIEAASEIGRMRANGYEWSAISRSLNARMIPTPSGRGRWDRRTVARYYDPTQRQRWSTYVAAYQRARRAV